MGIVFQPFAAMAVEYGYWPARDAIRAFARCGEDVFARNKIGRSHPVILAQALVCRTAFILWPGTANLVDSGMAALERNTGIFAVKPKAAAVGVMHGR